MSAISTGAEALRAAPAALPALGTFAAAGSLHLQFVILLVWGFVGTVVLTMTMTAAQGLHLSRMSIPMLLGTMFTPNRDRAAVAGSLLHFILGWAFSFIYAVLFESLRLAVWWFGAILGFTHGLFMLVFVIPLVPAIHPRMATSRQGPSPTRLLQPPGFLALHYGWRSPVVTMIAHVLYGIVLGAFYQISGA